MTCDTTLLADVGDAQTRNIHLVGEDLRDAGRKIAALAVRGDCALLAVDVSRRLDGQSVVNVAGFVAGSAGIALKAAVAQSLGAVRVDVAVLGTQVRQVDGCDHVRPITGQPHRLAS